MWKFRRGLSIIFLIYLPTQTPTQKCKNGFTIYSSHEIGSSLILFEMIFEALPSSAQVNLIFIPRVQKYRNSRNPTKL